MTSHAPPTSRRRSSPATTGRCRAAVYRLFCRLASMQRQQLHLSLASRPLNWEATVRNLMQAISTATALRMSSSRYRITQLRPVRSQWLTHDHGRHKTRRTIYERFTRKAMSCIPHRGCDLG